VPGEHEAGIFEELPAGQKKPSPQSSHAVPPASGWYVPSSQRWQRSLPSSVAYVPAVHSVGWCEPSEHALPGGQGSQPSVDATPVSSL